ncbi:hypothetical protein QYF61_007627 [Mycteria americana]|uniref:Reverse transcriptase domain-containing protein n=1 Tax=Mycteria americana TaxID=33587 RepID=A0AAN7NFF1_MYCAM|nr:hypothetical protein QYF61_007627 [Mycteria americana]
MAKQAAFFLVFNFCIVDSDPPVNDALKLECWELRQKDVAAHLFPHKLVQFLMVQSRDLNHDIQAFQHQMFRSLQYIKSNSRDIECFLKSLVILIDLGLPSPLSWEDHKCGNSDFLFVDIEIVRDQMYQLNIHKSMGPDRIHPRVLKELVDVTAGPLSIICQRSWESGEVPADWKLANVIPIYKKGAREDPGNYRPVSLTSVLGKITEKVILGTIERHLKNNTIIRHSRHGFTKGKLCSTNLIAFYDKVTCLVNEGKVVDVVFLDFSKAFDTVPLSTLLDKLSSCGISGFRMHRMKNWLKGRAQRVVGSVLGPVLCNIFINNLDAGVECTISKSADELGDAVDSLKGQEALQRDLDRLEHWAMTNGMKFNKTKCQILHLGRSNTGHKYKLGEENSPAERDLGVLLASRLNESAACPGSQGSKPLPGVHQTQHNQPVKRGRLGSTNGILSPFTKLYQRTLNIKPTPTDNAATKFETQSEQFFNVVCKRQLEHK